MALLSASTSTSACWGKPAASQPIDLRSDTGKENVALADTLVDTPVEGVEMSTQVLVFQTSNVLCLFVYTMLSN